MVGTIIVSLGDSGSGSNAAASNPVLGDILSLLSAVFYAAYITLIRRKLPDEDDEVQGRVSMAQVLGFMGLFNLLIFFPVILILEFLKLHIFNNLTGKQFGLIIGKGIISLFQPAVEILRSSVSNPFSLELIIRQGSLFRICIYCICIIAWSFYFINLSCKCSVFVKIAKLASYCFTLLHDVYRGLLQSRV